jgi:hypothetical protein
MMPPDCPGTGSILGLFSTIVSAVSGNTGRIGSGAPPGSIDRLPDPPVAGSQPDPASGPHRFNKLLQDACDALGSKILFAHKAPGDQFFKEDPASRNCEVVLANNRED